MPSRANRKGELEAGAMRRRARSRENHEVISVSLRLQERRLNPRQSLGTGIIRSELRDYRGKRRKKSAMTMNPLKER